jgi:type IV pilus assembly protein PilM
VIDVDSFALANAFLKNFEGAVDPEKTVALINIGDRYTNLDILKGSLLNFSRDIQIGGRDVNESIARILNVDAKLAEKLKHQPEDRAADVSMPIRMVLANIIDELRLSFGYFENRFGRGVDDVYLSGGSCNLIGLKEFFEESLGSKTAVWDPLKAFIVDDATMQAALTNDVRCSLAVSVGLAIR